MYQSGDSPQIVKIDIQKLIKKGVGELIFVSLFIMFKCAKGACSNYDLSLSFWWMIITLKE